MLQNKLVGPRPAQQKIADGAKNPEVGPGGAKNPEVAAGDAKNPEAGPDAEAVATTADSATDPVRERPPGPAGPTPDARPDPDPQSVTRVALGSAHKGSRMLVILNNRGGGIERIESTERRENGDFRYRSLEDHSGYLGPLGLVADPASEGLRVTVVGNGTPAAAAVPADSGDPPGLQSGDLITEIDGQRYDSTLEFDQWLAATEPGQSVRFSITRIEAGEPRSCNFVATLERRPLTLVQSPEVGGRSGGEGGQLSCLLTITRVGKLELKRGLEEISELPSLRDGIWRVQTRQEAAGMTVEFRFTLTTEDLKPADVAGPLEIIKRYRLMTPDSSSDASSESGKRGRFGYHLDVDVEIQNQGTGDVLLAYQLDGANGMPLEGWWYSYKINTDWGGNPGARDIAWRMSKSDINLLTATEVLAATRESAESPDLELLPESGEVNYIGVDTKYFATMWLPREGGPNLLLARARAAAVGRYEGQQVHPKKVNVTCRMILPEGEPIRAGMSRRHEFTLFAGPKDKEVLKAYGLDALIIYGWPLFTLIASFLSGLLHIFARLPFVNYGLAVIMLTVVVRSCMFPVSRIAAKNAAMMQELAPEMKAIAAQYKDNLEKRGQAQRDLFKKHNYNPFGGCLLMFLQLPVFIGLYKSLSVDIGLRQASLFPGIDWCSDLAAPDRMFSFPSWMPDLLIAEGRGWLGPYFNLLPMVTIALFIVQQKLFTPPATDDQQRMQQKIMKYMMVFMGVMFFKVPSGLCVYFIASSLWGIAERTLIPKPQVSSVATKGGAVVPPAQSEDASVKRKRRRPSPAQRKRRK